MLASGSRFAESVFWYLLALTGCSILLFEFGPERVLDIKNRPHTVEVTRALGASEASARYAPSLEGEPGVSCIRSGEHNTYPGCGLSLTLSAPPPSRGSTSGVSRPAMCA